VNLTNRPPPDPPVDSPAWKATAGGLGARNATGIDAEEKVRWCMEHYRKVDSSNKIYAGVQKQIASKPKAIQIAVQQALNQLAEGGRLPNTSALVERYGQRFRLQDLDNPQPIPSGLLSVPRLVAER